MDARKLTPMPHMAYMEFQPGDFRQHWWAVQMGGQKLLDTMLPATAESAITQEVLKYNAGWMDRAVWQSVYDKAGVETALENGLKPGDNSLIFMDGLLKKIQEEPGTAKILPDSQEPAVPITTANVFNVFERVKKLFPEAVYENPKFKFMTSYRDSQTFGDAQKAQGSKGVDVTAAGVMSYDGKPVVALQGLPPNTVVAGLASRDLESNFWMGVHEVDEEMFLHLKKKAQPSLFHYLWMMWKMDVNFALPGQTVLYTTSDYRS